MKTVSTSIRLISIASLVLGMGLSGCDGSSSSRDECYDGVRNGDESDIDCGGADCGGCYDGSDCVDGTDCLVGVCTDGICGECIGSGCVTPPTCTDGVTDGMESDVDCGGADCDGCADGSNCNHWSDCLSGECNDNICGECLGSGCVTPPTCSDGLLNGDESDIDCGGAECDGCADGSDCTDGSDCLSGECNDDICGAADCVPGPLSGEVTAWLDFWQVAFPGPGYKNEPLHILDAGYHALEFNTGSVVDHGGVITVANTGSNGTRLASISECLGDFNVPPECTHSWGSSGGIGWATDGEPGYCQLAPNTTYYLNFTFTDGLDGATTTCLPSETCVTTVQALNLD